MISRERRCRAGGRFTVRRVSGLVAAVLVASALTAPAAMASWSGFFVTPDDGSLRSWLGPATPAVDAAGDTVFAWHYVDTVLTRTRSAAGVLSPVQQPQGASGRVRRGRVH